MAGVAQACLLKVLFVVLAIASSDGNPAHHHHHHHGHHKHHRGGDHSNASQVQQPPSVQPGSPQRHALVVATSDKAVPPQRYVHSAAAGTVALHAHPADAAAPRASDEQILEKMKKLETELAEKEEAAKLKLAKGHLIVNGPLPVDFSDRFAQGVADATGCRPEDVNLLGAVPARQGAISEEEIMFRSRKDVVAAVEHQAADPESKLANGVLHKFLMSGNEPEEEDRDHAESTSEHEERESPEAASPTAPEVDMSMPYGDLEPFGREDTAQELTESSIRESNAMVDQLERAEVAEEKRAVFRALTRLRGAAITSYDGIARSQTGNIDDYARENQWRKVHPVHHLAQEEADVSRWAFPEDADE